MLKAVQVALVFTAAALGVVFFGAKTYASVALVIFVLAVVVLVTVEREDITLREGVWIFVLSVLAGAMWCAWPLIVVFGFFGERAVVLVDEPLQDPSSVRRKSEGA